MSLLISTTTTNSNHASLGSRFVLIHSLSEKIIHDDDHQNKSSSPILSNQPLTQSAQDDRQKLLQEIHQSKHKLVKQETEIASLNQSNQSIKTQNHELLNQIKSLKVDLSLIKNREKLGINQLSKELALEKSSRKEALRVLRNEFMELQDAYNQKKSSLIRLSSERDEIQSKYNKQTRELEDTIDNMISFSEENKKLKSDLTKLSNESETIRSTCRSLKQRSATFESKYEKYKTEVISLRNQIRPISSPSKPKLFDEASTSTSTLSHLPAISTPVTRSSSSHSHSNHRNPSNQISPSSLAQDLTTSSVQDPNRSLRKKPSMTPSRLHNPITPPTNRANQPTESQTSIPSTSQKPNRLSNSSSVSLNHSSLQKRSISQIDRSSSIEILNPSKKPNLFLDAQEDLHLPSLFGTTNTTSHSKRKLLAVGSSNGGGVGKDKIQGRKSSDGSVISMGLGTRNGVLCLGPKVKNR
ncbi:uncharacterized protein MELLADRAFT_78745 [Melampsora larici-populina 98AG31]|uniref:SWI5-dependent HO expression protein 3 n=1 Tax=Melampsora larici-populina (strain 98AG31 / pathotype 3-4-7) TaxID=747676 RepID=F4RY59_MELLP|nr:uncharacterized protein MELLADRAFT_78745 [Melampsora larici-populina 98AG31]EGG02625.1 hypothetical protein MELLADRAFT_78745 [Melampsora larici-populina 98AG31]